MKSLTNINPPAYIACLLLTFAMGGLHAYGALLESIEAELDVSRVAASWVYGTSLIGATMGVLWVPRLLRNQVAPLIASQLVALTLIAVVLVVALDYLGWLLGYGLLYGLASGGGYALCLSLAASCLGNDKAGVAIGGVTAAFALGSAWFAWSNSLWLNSFPVTHVFIITVMQVVSLSGIAILLWRRFPINLTFVPEGHVQLNSLGIWSLWFIYGAGVFAGLMVLGHALPILKNAGVSGGMAASTLALMALANGAACLLAGSLGDRYGFLPMLCLFLLLSVLSLLSMVWATGLVAVITMLIISALYGAFIALYPALVNRLYGQQSAPQIYGRIFTAWGLAGLTAAPLAAWLLYVFGSYTSALYIAAGFGLIALCSLYVRGERL